MTINIKHIEETIYNKLIETFGVVYINNQPKASSEQLPIFAVIDVGRIVRDFGAYKKTDMFVEVFVRDKKSGIENSNEIHRLVNVVLSMFPYSDDVFSVISPSVTFGDKEGEFTRAIIGFDLIIK